MGCNKPSDTSRRADELALEIKEIIGTPGIWGVHWNPPSLLQKLTWKRLSAKEKSLVVLSVHGDSLWVSISDKPKSSLPQTKAGNLKALLRKCLVHIDDENLYDEILKVVHDN